MNKNKRLELSVVLADFISLLLSYTFSSFFYLTVVKHDFEFLKVSYFPTLVVVVVAFFIAVFFALSKNRLFLQRDRYQEIFNIVKNTLLIGLAFSTVAYISSISFELSRGVFFTTLLSYIFIGSFGRHILKRKFLKKEQAWRSKMIIITTYEMATSKAFIKNVTNHLMADVVGFVIVDRNMVGETISGFKVVSDLNNLLNYCNYEIIDAALVSLNNGWWDQLEHQLTQLQCMGIVIHLGIDVLTRYESMPNAINYVGTYPVLTIAEALHSEESLIIKRCIDIIGGLVGSLFTIIVMIFLGPLIKLESPGPVLFKQRRVGKNGRYFDIYKFRSMGVDAEQRKKDLMTQNEVEGHMFKMTNDPRVTKIGKFIRATSIDELPQFFNVLKGDMSLVGTRPPTIEEFKEYEPHHKRRLSMKPGITGMWQVSGRSNIKDFEEVVRLDTQYIDNYTLALDFKILAKTFIVVFAKIGSK